MFYLRLIVLFIFTALPGNFVFAFETDQYNLPVEPLGDIGDEITDYTFANIVDAVEKLNGKIVNVEKCLDGVNTCDSKDKTDLHKELDYLRSEDAIALEIFRTMGAGSLMFTKAGTYVEKHKFTARPAKYKTSFIDSIYTTVPSNYFTISPTIRVYDHEFGTDKISHFYQQGYDYYKIYRRALRQKSSHQDAALKAVKWGKKTEATYFGNLVSGVYSNADLFANYIGLKFYLGISHKTTINGVDRPPVVVLVDNKWQINLEIDKYEQLIKPFISDHLNEALNPSLYIFGLRSTIKSSVRKKSCEQWHTKFPDLDKTDYETRFADMDMWNDENYGFKKSSHPLTIADLCFNSKEKGKVE